MSDRFMFVCICNQVTDKQIRRAVEEGACNLDTLSAELNVGTCCGKCKNCAKKVIREVMQDNMHVQLLPGGFSPVLSPA